MEYEPVIGLEVHAQLLTRSKMFCRCATQYAGAEPNTHICPVCAGFPGVLPVINERAVELAIRVGLALNCEIAPVSRFDRKHYPYPDLPKGYQVSQYDLPLAIRGRVAVGRGLRTEDSGLGGAPVSPEPGKDVQFEAPPGDAGAREVGVVRVHMEEDTGKTIHRRGHGGEVYSLVDYNRSGVPLLEIVSAPDIRSPEEAKEYVARLRQTLRYIDACSGNMEEGALRVDANVSVRPVGSAEFGAKVEIKNLNSLRAVERAIQFEIGRQSAVLGQGGAISQETRGWDEAAGETLEQRAKEYASDYRYFPEPDLPPLSVSEERRRSILERLPELPERRRARFVTQYALSAIDAEVLTASRDTAEFFEAAAAALDGSATPKQAANWITGELFRVLRRDGQGVADSKLTPAALAELVGMVGAGEVSAGSGRELLAAAHETGRAPRELAEERGLAQIRDQGELRSAVREVVLGNPKPVADYQAGKRQAVGFLVGQVMKRTQGRAKADIVRELLVEELGATGS